MKTVGTKAELQEQADSIQTALERMCITVMGNECHVVTLGEVTVMYRVLEARDELTLDESNNFVKALRYTVQIVAMMPNEETRSGRCSATSVLGAVAGYLASWVLHA